jgi:hypothetical protein
MTIEEYLKSEISYAKNAMVGNYDTEELNHYEGYKEAMEAVLEHLPKLDHEVTVWEVVEECLKHENDGGCENCVLLRDNPYRCELGGMPAGWGFKRIEKKMKEARHDA